MLWGASATANLCMWMNELAATWLMSTLSSDPMLVALVRTAATLPGFFLALPSGAMADIVDRRRWFMGTQWWVTAVAALLALAVWTGAVSPPVLLMLVLGYGTGLALRWPVYSAIVADIVPRHELGQAVALNSVSANVSRIVGPVIAGATLVWFGSAWVFSLIAALSFGAATVVWLWRPPPRRASALPAERFFSAMRAGVRYAAQSPPLRAVLLRSFVFFLQTAALLALLPLVAKRLQGGEATYTLLMCGMSVGAIVTAAGMPRWLSRFRTLTVVRAGTLLYAAGAIAAALAPNIGVALLAMLPAGAAWFAVSSVLTTSAQMALPDWARARGMALHLMAVMAGYAAGAALWGAVARYAGVPASLVASSILGLVALGAIRQHFGDDNVDDLTSIEPGTDCSAPAAAITCIGPIIVTIEYIIDAQDEAEFEEVMNASRRSRLQGGATAWNLLRDAVDARRRVEYFVDENWVEHARRLERRTAGDARIKARRLALHKGTEPPRVTRYVGSV